MYLFVERQFTKLNVGSPFIDSRCYIKFGSLDAKHMERIVGLESCL